MGRVLKPVSKISGVYGQPGEEKVSQVLAEGLPDQYVILNSPRLYYHGATFDIDHVIIGPNGIFVIETKNMHGFISGGLMGNWNQTRKRSGRNRVARIGNPANQVNQYSKVVRSQLKSRFVHETGNKIKLMVYPLVAFVHDEVDLSQLEYTKSGYVGRVRILKLEELIDFILNRQAISYEQSDIDFMAELLVPVNQREQTSYFSLDKFQDFNNNQEMRYEIYEELGRGTFGVVFRGFDYKLDKEIAIKKLQLQNNSDPAAINRFYREAQIASGLSHENIIGVYDYYENAGDYYIVMELVEGPTLDQYIKENKISIKEALRIFRQVCSAIKYAHGKHVVHRDLKPSNILIDTDGTVKVTDFGIAKLMNTTELTMEGLGPGTPVVMSPEQIAGKEVNEKSDIFSLGILLYYLLTRELPFNGDHVGEIAHKITYLDPVQPSTINKEISYDLESVIYKALEKNPDDRFDDVAQFLKAVDELLATGRLCTPIGKKRLYIKFVPSFLRPYFKTERSLISTIIIASLVVFIIILGFQSYKDYKELTRGGIPSKQYGFTNENAKQIFSDPEKFKGLPADILGRIEKVTKIDQNSTQFLLMLQTKEDIGPRSVLIVFNSPHSTLPLTTNIEISGSVQGYTKQNGYNIPVVVADKIQAVEDPWALLAPSLFTIYPNKAVNQSGKVVYLEKIEFSQYETRLYVRVRNEGTTNDVIYISNPIGKQGLRQFKEVKTDYGIVMRQTFQLAPRQEAGTVLFIEPMDYKSGSATFVLGTNNDILTGQQPFKFDIKW